MLNIASYSNPGTYNGGDSTHSSSNSSSEQIDPDLQAVIDQWDGLPDAVKAGVVAMVAASKDQQG